MPAFASSMPRSSPVLKDFESSVIVGSSDGKYLAFREFYARSSLVLPNSEPVLKNSEGLLVLWTEPDDRARSVHCEQPYEPNPRWCSVAVCRPCGGRQRGNGCELYPLNANRQRQVTVAGLQAAQESALPFFILCVPSTMAQRPANKLVPNKGGGSSRGKRNKSACIAQQEFSWLSVCGTR
jgi:hypothetical protein